MHTHLLTTHDASVGTTVLPATHVVISLNREDVEWAEYKSNNFSGV